MEDRTASINRGFLSIYRSRFESTNRSPYRTHHRVKKPTSEEGSTSMAVFWGRFADGSPLFGSFDAKYKKFGDKQSFPWVLEIDIRATDVSDDGLPTVEENVVLNDYEDSIMEILSRSTAILVVGHITGAGARLIYSYLPSPNPAYEILKKFCAGKPMRELGFEIDHDPEWLRVADIVSR